jgi:hypothetical protein
MDKHSCAAGSKYKTEIVQIIRYTSKLNEIVHLLSPQAWCRRKIGGRYVKVCLYHSPDLYNS